MGSHDVFRGGRMQKFILTVMLAASAMLAGCAGVPKGIAPVENFNAQRYLGAWYEIARLEHRQEKGLRNITAHYRLRDDGGIDVLNRGYDPQKGEWRTAKGKAYFVKGPDVGHLKVSFYGPFYDSYIVFGLDEADYQYAYVTSSDKNSLWFLSRNPHVSEKAMDRFIKKARELGFATDKLVYVEQKSMDGDKAFPMHPLKN
jgi:apolipoprotein D and lipocalin family protein